MEPCSGRVGVIFSPEEAGIAIEKLREYVDNDEIVRATGARDALLSAEAVRSAQGSYEGGVFVGAIAALEISRILKRESGGILAALGRSGIVMGAMYHPVPFVVRDTKSEMARQITHTISQSRKLNRQF